MSGSFLSVSFARKIFLDIYRAFSIWIGAHKSASTIMYQKLNRKIEQLSKWSYIVGIGLALGVYMLPLVMMCYINYYVNDMGAEAFELPSPMMYAMQQNDTECSVSPHICSSCSLVRFPYDEKKPFNYLISVTLMSLSMFPVILSQLACFFFLMGSCWFFILFVKDLIDDLDYLSIGGISTKRGRTKMKLRFCNVIRNHLDVKQLSVTICFCMQNKKECLSKSN